MLSLLLAHVPKPFFCMTWSLDQRCPGALSVVMEMFCICAVRRVDTRHGGTEHVKCS